MHFGTSPHRHSAYLAYWLPKSSLRLALASAESAGSKWRRDHGSCSRVSTKCEYDFCRASTSLSVSARLMTVESCALLLCASAALPSPPPSEPSFAASAPFAASSALVEARPKLHARIERRQRKRGALHVASGGSALAQPLLELARDAQQPHRIRVRAHCSA
eukprot:CAMPEP_0119375818 /NCGR_PEP_ID=MMETSP1334-20130426/36685_1 /TAXON_ID=127549 /ORGANISM="Calcidiscus leptoporus, Strain RCC1130" /LENGTH=161 /DNA_ID=CAMNT_0007394215 /DNA_START=317 /DNA_END=801 /DNA_ORIENTATION=+